MLARAAIAFVVLMAVATAQAAAPAFGPRRQVLSIQASALMTELAAAERPGQPREKCVLPPIPV